MISSVIMIIYLIMSAIIALILLREIIRTKNIQEAILFCIILIPFVLRTLHIK